MTVLQIVAPFIGAIALEALHWYQLREKTGTAQFRRAVRSVAYWVITAVMIIVGGVGALIYFGERLSAGELLIAGAAFPTLLKKLIAPFVKKQTKLGSPEDAERAEHVSPAPVGGYFSP